MIRTAFPLIGGRHWTGGYNYLLNLVRVLGQYVPRRIAPVLFFGTDVSADDLAPFADLPGVEVVRDATFDEARRGVRLRRALLHGRDTPTLDLFRAHRIQAAFEPAIYFGWRTGIPTLAWMPDFQHRHLPHLFPRGTRVRRDLGLRAQLASGRRIMLSSENARADCERFYPASVGRTEVVRFAVPRPDPISTAQADAAAAAHRLPERFFYLPNQFWVHKNHALVVQALAALKSQGRPMPVIAASGHGDDPRRPGHFAALQAEVAGAGLGDALRMLGSIPYPHVAHLMRAATALINPSLFEGWSTTVEEAKSTGTPLLLSAIGVHREQAPDAIFFDPTNSIALATALADFRPLGQAERERCAVDAAQRSLAAATAFGEAFARAVTNTVRERA